MGSKSKIVKRWSVAKLAMEEDPLMKLVVVLVSAMEEKNNKDLGFL